MLNTVYKIFAKVVANRITHVLMKWISSEQKGFIKGRNLIEAVISLWEGIEYAQDSKQDVVFVKVDFDKAYDRLEWSFILLSLEHMGFGPMLIRFVRTLFGQARARIAFNGLLSNFFELNRSVRQGCPLAPLLFAISVDGLNCLVKARMSEGKIKGIQLPNSKGQQCLSQFADDTNGLIANEEESLWEFWQCLQLFCVASGSKINHSKTGVKQGAISLPQWLLAFGCKLILPHQPFRLLGIPMGFGISLNRRTH
ncbi:hypothetical protein L7F22_017160 [Adiantum nelumboides]|nr:hypothetical protein [Adiantum nelumboides]